jgi:hypothetical protein
MRDFRETGYEKQCEILAKLIERLGQSKCYTLEGLAAKEGKSVEAVWGEICEACDTELCTIPYRVLPRGARFNPIRGNWRGFGPRLQMASFDRTPR